MQRGRSKIDDGAGAVGRPPARAPGGLLRKVGVATVGGCLALLVLLGLGFLWFVWQLPVDEVTINGKADGIVVFTGGASRTSDAIELLAAGKSQRLLISGANRATTSNEISRINPDFARFAKCCVDFDHSLNTLGNAVETRKWAEKRGIRSLIVVTSSYHMPRAMAELTHQLPNVTLIAFPVVSDRLKSDPWWSNGDTVRLLGLEYLKFVFAHVRMRLNPGAGSDD
jgi:uncharacterized SAM-binding protein YcdF (DUF218 family)